LQAPQDSSPTANVNARDAAITLSLALQHGGHCSIHVRTDGALALFGCLASYFVGSFGAPKLEDVALKKFPRYVLK
jgi:hypothetical protein